MAPPRPDDDDSTSRTSTTSGNDNDSFAGSGQRGVANRADYPMTNIKVLCDHDVLCGRGGGTNNHSGNIRFRKLVNGHKIRYLAAPKVNKPKVARDVVKLWRALDPPGRFLARVGSATNTNDSAAKEENVLWYDVGDKKAREKASQCLRERTPDVLPFVNKLKDKDDKIKKSIFLGFSEVGGSVNSLTANGDVGKASSAQQSSEINVGGDGSDFFQEQMASPLPSNCFADFLPRATDIGSVTTRTPSAVPMHSGSSSHQQHGFPGLAGQFIVASNFQTNSFRQQNTTSLGDEWAFDTTADTHAATLEMQQRQQQDFDQFVLNGGTAADYHQGQQQRLGCKTIIFEGNKEDCMLDESVNCGDLTLEEYQDSLTQYLAKEFGPEAAANLGFRAQIMSNMKQHEWAQSFHSIDTFSMTDSSTPGDSVKMPPDHQGGHIMNSDSYFRRLSTSETTLPTNNSFQHMYLNHPNAATDFQQQQQQQQQQLFHLNHSDIMHHDNCLPETIAPSTTQPTFQASVPVRNNSSRSQKMRTAKNGALGTSNISNFSNVSMFSDMSDGMTSIFKSGRSGKMNAARSMQSEISMMSELTDLSGAVSAMSLHRDLGS